jgi:hypothetical protein
MYFQVRRSLRCVFHLGFGSWPRLPSAGRAAVPICVNFALLMEIATSKLMDNSFWGLNHQTAFRSKGTLDKWLKSRFRQISIN